MSMKSTRYLAIGLFFLAVPMTNALAAVTDSANPAVVNRIDWKPQSAAPTTNRGFILYNSPLSISKLCVGGSAKGRPRTISVNNYTNDPVQPRDCYFDTASNLCPAGFGPVVQLHLNSFGLEAANHLIEPTWCQAADYSLTTQTLLCSLGFNLKLEYQHVPPDGQVQPNIVYLYLQGGLVTFAVMDTSGVIKRATIDSDLGNYESDVKTVLSDNAKKKTLATQDRSAVGEILGNYGFPVDKGYRVVMQDAFSSVNALNSEFPRTVDAATAAKDNTVCTGVYKYQPVSFSYIVVCNPAAAPLPCP